ncbi:hypothetical protein [Candidatus Clostridium stratigraminis]|uniref:Lipoprotein n=1 Tax=Candidatus Clostridium stratigraminis TaxID=3381661 RepID=A0ABW8SZ23_9CLOT
MRRKTINAMVLCFAVLLTFILGGCFNSQKKASSEKSFEQTIDEKLYNITHPKDSTISLSSNPYDYIKNTTGKENYQYIVRNGKKSLDYLLVKFESSSKNGLEEYIMAIACSEILKEDPAAKKWDSGKAWYDNYIKTKK